ncbi:MAG: PIN domain-containing protein [Candidatus Njordarchaeia archaeon]|nr:PIN domain-containing protein [Candidatus Korarchaeota archaeon]
MKILLDTTYLLPLIGIGIKELDRIFLRKIIREHQVFISNITLFELAAKGSKFVVKNIINAQDVMDGLKTIQNDERIEIIDPFSSYDTLQIGFLIRKFLSDYIDTIITATAIKSCEILLTEDKKIHKLKNIEEFKKLVKIKNSRFEILSAKEFSLY